jgi:hypothetical protein
MDFWKLIFTLLIFTKELKSGSPPKNLFEYIRRKVTIRMLRFG